MLSTLPLPLLGRFGDGGPRLRERGYRRLPAGADDDGHAD
jgi:hypothetical protein